MVDDPKKKRQFARIGRLNGQINLGKLLFEYGYDVYEDDHREQQFRCDLHGDDNKPSARYYPETNSTYCWACQKARRPVDYHVEKEGFGDLDTLLDDPSRLNSILAKLETRYGLPGFTWTPDSEPENEAKTWIDEKIRAFEGASTSTFKDDRLRIRRLLETATRERDLDLDTTLKFWEVFDRIDFGMRHEDWTETQGKTALAQLRAKLMESFKCSPA